MSNITTQAISADEWLKIRDKVASEVKAAHPRIEPSTSTKISEHLLRIGLIDLDTTHDLVTPKPATPDPDDERVAPTEAETSEDS